MICQIVSNIQHQGCLQMIPALQLCMGKTLNEAEEIANKDLKNVKVWLSSNKLSLNIAKTEYILIGSRPKINSMDVS